MAPEIRSSDKLRNVNRRLDSRSAMNVPRQLTFLCTVSIMAILCSPTVTTIAGPQSSFKPSTIPLTPLLNPQNLQDRLLFSYTACLVPIFSHLGFSELAPAAPSRSDSTYLEDALVLAVFKKAIFSVMKKLSISPSRSSIEFFSAAIHLAAVRMYRLARRSSLLNGPSTIFAPSRCLTVTTDSPATSPSPRNELVYVVRLAKQADRYDEMVEFLRKVSAPVDKDKLSIENRDLLSVTYKNVIGARCASWRIIPSIGQKEERRGNKDHVATILDYRSKIETELSMTRNPFSWINEAVSSSTTIYYVHLSILWGVLVLSDLRLLPVQLPVAAIDHGVTVYTRATTTKGSSNPIDKFSRGNFTGKSTCHCITVTSDSINRKSSTAANVKDFIGGMEVTQPELFNNGMMVLHGIQSSVSPLCLFPCDEETTSFTFPCDLHLHSWPYRVKPSVTHESYKPRVPSNGRLLSEFNQYHELNEEVSGTHGCVVEDGSTIQEAEIRGLHFTALFAGQNTGSIISTRTGAYLLYQKQHLSAVLEEQKELRGKYGDRIDHDILTEMDVLYRGVKEALMLHLSRIMIMRSSHSNFNVKSPEGIEYDIPNGHIIATSSAFANRLPYLFRDPDHYDLDRFAPGREEAKAFSYISFQGVWHGCFSETFAYLQINANWGHFIAEGVVEFKAVLLVPPKVPHDQFPASPFALLVSRPVLEDKDIL